MLVELPSELSPVLPLELLLELLFEALVAPVVVLLFRAATGDMYIRTSF